MLLFRGTDLSDAHAETQCSSLTPDEVRVLMEMLNKSEETTGKFIFSFCGADETRHRVKQY